MNNWYTDDRWGWLGKGVVVSGCVLIWCCAASSDQRSGRGELFSGAGEVNEAGDDQVVPSTDELPALVALGLRHYRRGRWREAIEAFSGASFEGDAAATAQFFLAKALFHSGFFYSAASVFAQIAEDHDHPYFFRTLPWLVVLDERCDDQLFLLGAIGAYRLRDLGSGAPSQAAEVDARLSLLLGLARYYRGELPSAAASLSKVPASSLLYPKARLLLGLTQARRGESLLALNAFSSVEVAVARLEGRLGPEGDRLRDRALLEAASVHSRYGDQRRELLSLAGETYGRVRRGGPLWWEALYRQAWVYERLGEHERALSNIKALPRAFLASTPEVRVLEAAILVEQGRRAEAAELSAAIEGELLALPGQLEAWVAERGSSQLAKAFREEAPRDDRDVAALLLERTATKALLGIARSLPAIDEERQRLASALVADPAEQTLLRRLRSHRQRREGRMVAATVELARGLGDELRRLASRVATLRSELLAQPP